MHRMVELVWDGKYKDGKKVAPVRVALPFQTIETVNESAQERQKMLDFFSSGRDTDWRNRLIWGDKKYVLPSLLAEFAGKVDLIYIDPPFATGSDFSFTATVPDDPDEDGDQGQTFLKQPSILEQKAYRDTWGRGLDSFMQWFYETVLILRELLSENGSIYVHLDNNASHCAKVVLDEVFGEDNFISEIVWKRSDAHNDAKTFGSVHDVIFFYSKSQVRTFNTQYIPLSEKTADSWYKNIDEAGRRYNLADLSSPNPRPNLTYEYSGIKPPKNGWRYSRERMEELDAQGKIIRSGNTLKLKRYLDESKGTVLTDLWTDVSQVRGYGNSGSDDVLPYRTQKPEALLDRIIKASSNPSDLVLDCFCGSGTTAAVAEKLGRRWITCDLGRFAIHTARKRLLGIQGVKPFVVQNLGKYERQAWQAAEFDNPQDAAAKEARYRAFILDLYKADAITSGAWLHGIKQGRSVHVGAVDAPVTIADVRAIARETLARIGTGEDAPQTAGVDVLGWDFAFELNELGQQVAADAGVNVRFRKIPREVLEKKAVDQGDIRFFELAAATVSHSVKGRTATLELKDFIISPDDVPADVMQSITHWSQWVDYWAVDWNYREDTFHNEWQAYRTKKSPKLEVKAVHVYEEPGVYTVLVKVIDLLGNDTTKAVQIEVK